MYKVLEPFSGDEKKDGYGGVFNVGDPYPKSSDFEPSKARITYLLNEAKQKNKIGGDGKGRVLLEYVGGNQKQLEVEPEPVVDPYPEPQPDYPPDDYQEPEPDSPRRRNYRR